MDTKKELKILFWMIVVYAAVFFMPLGNERFMTAVDATLDLAKWYAQEHVMLCLLPTFFIAGVIAVFVSQRNSHSFCFHLFSLFIQKRGSYPL